MDNTEKTNSMVMEFMLMKMVIFMMESF